MMTTIFEIPGRAAGNLGRVAELGSAHPPVGGKLKPLALAYAVWWLLSLVAFTTIISLRAEHKPAPSLVDRCVAICPGALEDKLAYYREHKSAFDLILLGDSLTYTGLHPEFIDPELGAHSVNMAIFANWFATQYPFIQDLIPEIPRGTRVLWSVHIYDFDDGLSVPRVYPVELANAIRYWSWGAHNAGLADNLLYYNPLTSFFVQRDELRAHVIGRGDTPVSLPRLISPAFAGADFPAAPKFVGLQRRALPDTVEVKKTLTEYYSGWSFVGAVDVVSDDRRVNSVILQLKRGGYYRIELTPEYFLSRQKGGSYSATWNPSISPVSLRTFEAGLAAFKQAGIPVTVNAMEEAPWTFVSETVRERNRAALDKALRPIVASYGDDYVHADYRSITNSDYFDYNHFNSDGIAKYTPLLIRELRKLPGFAHSSAK